MDFNEAQINAVRHGDGPMLLLAGPGSGKTTVLTHRIKYMIEQLGIRPDNILVITFTKAAANEMKTRFEMLAEGTRGVTFGTFHSVFFWILRNAYNYTVANIASDTEKYAFIRDCVDRHGFKYDSQEDFAKNVLAEIGLVKSGRIDINGYKSVSMKPEDFAVVYAGYENFLRNSGKLDFEDMLVFTYELLSERQDILSMWQDKFRYILIDEFQDINGIQYDIVKLLAGNRRNVFAVGDDDQSIYGFRGAAPSIMKRFPEDFENTAVECLNVNYRCSYDIVECSKRIISCNTDRYDKNLQSAYEPGKSGRVHVVKVADVGEQNRQIVKKIREENGAGIPFSDMAVIYRTNTQPRGLASKLMENGIPFSMRDSIPNIFTHFLAQNVIDYIKVAIGDRSRSTVLKIINKPNRYVSRDSMDSAVVNFEDVMEYYKDNYRTVNNIKVLVNDLDRLSKLPPYAAVNYIRKAIGLDAYARDYAEYRGISQDDYADILDELQESARDFPSFDKWYEYIDEYTRSLYEKNRRMTVGTDSVTLSTMHGVKGLEFSHVFIIDAVEGVTPHKKSVREERIEEERRLFYVAVTRAKYGLYIYVPKKVYGKSCQTSRFVQEMLVDRNLIKTGNRIVHRKYGQGLITYVDEKKLCVYFERMGETKTLSLDYTIKNELIENA